MRDKNPTIAPPLTNASRYEIFELPIEPIYLIFTKWLTQFSCSKSEHRCSYKFIDYYHGAAWESNIEALKNIPRSIYFVRYEFCLKIYAEIRDKAARKLGTDISSSIAS